MLPGILYLTGVALGIGCVLGVEPDPRAWTAPRVGQAIAGFICLFAGIWMAISVL